MSRRRGRGTGAARLEVLVRLHMSETAALCSAPFHNMFVPYLFFFFPSDVFPSDVFPNDLFRLRHLGQAGDTMAMWLPECSEKHVAQLAAARIGMVVAEVDPKLASATAVEKILEESGAAVRGAPGAVFRFLAPLVVCNVSLFSLYFG